MTCTWLGARYGRAGDKVDAAVAAQVPEANGAVLRAGDEHRPAPGVQREDGTRVAGQAEEGGRRLAVGDVDLAVAGAAGQQQTAAVGEVVHEAEVADGAVVHRQLRLIAEEAGRFRVEGGQLDGLVVGAGGQQVADLVPGQTVAVDCLFVCLCLCCVVLGKMRLENGASAK